MKPHHYFAALLLTNIMLWGLLSGRSAHEEFDIITVREFRLVDEKNKERANIKVEADGEVVFRLRDDSGTIRVKLGADKNGSGFVFMDENSNPAIHGLAKKSAGKITVTDGSGKKHEY